jgi:hypothetical protein
VCVTVLVWYTYLYSCVVCNCIYMVHVIWYAYILVDA